MQELNYIYCGNYYIPDIRLHEENRPIGKWGRLHQDYLKEHHPVRYQVLVLSGKLWTYLSDLNEQAEVRFALIMDQMSHFQGVNEELKGKDQLAWVAAKNSIKCCAEEIVLRELIYEEDVR